MTLRAWWHALRDAAKGFRDKSLSDSAAALTYYSILAIFPALLVLVSLLGVLGTEETVEGLLRIVDDLGEASASETLRGPLEKIVDNASAASLTLLIGLAIALYSASGYIGAFIRASNEIWEVDEDRPFWKLRPLQLLITVGMVVAVAAILMIVVLGGPVADSIGSELGFGDTALEVWATVRWPLLFAATVTVIAMLYRVSPDVRHHGIRWILPGAGLAAVLWLAASAGFNLYVTNFGSYSNTYGSLAGAIIFLIWLWLTNTVILFGAQFAEELERTGAAAEAAAPTDAFAPLRSAGDADHSAAPGSGTGAASSTSAERDTGESSGSPPARR
jgi:membrane protein